MCLERDFLLVCVLIGQIATGMARGHAVREIETSN